MFQIKTVFKIICEIKNVMIKKYTYQMISFEHKLQTLSKNRKLMARLCFCNNSCPFLLEVSIKVQMLYKEVSGFVCLVKCVIRKKQPPTCKEEFDI